MSSNPVRLADYVASFVADQGVGCVFLVPGGGSMYLVDAFGAQPRLTYVANHHEQASSIAAEAYSRINGRLGVALVTTGPGGTNAVTGCAGAWIESVPLLIISGQVKRADLIGDSGVRQMGPQEVDIVSIVRPITKYAATVLDPADIRFHLEQAVHLATTGRRGPVWIDIPLDVQNSVIDAGALRGYAPPAADAGKACESGGLRSRDRHDRGGRAADHPRRPRRAAGRGRRAIQVALRGAGRSRRHHLERRRSDPGGPSAERRQAGRRRPARAQFRRPERRSPDRDRRASQQCRDRL